MKNQKGFTSIELLVSFVIVSAIAVGLFDVVLNYRNTQQIASYEVSIQSYIDDLTRVVQRDLIKRKLKAVSISGKTATFTFETPDSKGSTTSKFEVYQSDAKCLSDCHITYGPTGDEIHYPLPNIADLTIQNASITLNQNFLVIDILLEHPNFKNQKQIYITAPNNYTK